MRDRLKMLYEGMTPSEQWVLVGLIVVATGAVGLRQCVLERERGFELIAQYDEKTDDWVSTLAPRSETKPIARFDGSASPVLAARPDGGVPAPLATDPRLDLNTASAPELETLPGIGTIRAEAIVSYRTLHGPFAQMEDLLAVSGIGAGTLEAVRPLARCGPLAGAIAPTPSSPAFHPPAPVKGAVLPTQPNTHRPALPGGGALRDSAGRLNINRAQASDLDGLPGIGPVLARRIVDYRAAHGPFRSVSDLESVSQIGPKTRAGLEPYVFVGP